MYGLSNAEAIEKIKLATGIGYSKEQLDILNHRGGMCVLACAGSGKTSVLTSLIAKRILTGEIEDSSRLLCATYSRTGAQEMEERLSSLFKSLGLTINITVKTLHAFYLMILKRFGYKTDVIDTKTRTKYISEACKDAKILLNDDELVLIDTLLSYQVNNLMGDEQLVKSKVFTLENVTKEQYVAVRTGYQKRKLENEYIDFDDMQLIMYSMLVNSNSSEVSNYCRSVYTDYYIDEAQDISKIQFAILRALITDSNKLVFIGDDDQCIYEWRGADPSIIQNICSYYDIKKMILSTNYRCKNSIVDMAAVGIKHNSGRTEKTMNANTNGGSIKICDTASDNIYSISKYAYKHIKYLVEEEGVSPGDIAVLSRNNQHLSILNNMLFADGIYCTAAQEMRFTKSNLYKDLRGVLELATNQYSKHLTENYLWKVCQYLGTKGAKTIAQIQDTVCLSLKDTLGLILTISGYNSDLKWNKQIKIANALRAKIEYIYEALKAQTLNDMKVLYKLYELDENNTASGMLAMYETACEFMYKPQDRKRILKGFVEYMLDMIRKEGLDELKSRLRATEQYEDGKVAVPGAKITLSTMHGAKGKEWKHVILFAADNITFPSFENIYGMIKKGVSIRDISDSIDEDRRLCYVACTRAKEELTILTDSNNMSVYLLESLGIFNPPDGSNDMHIISMASSGALYRNLIEAVKQQIFKGNSKYQYVIKGVSKNEKSA